MRIQIEPHTLVRATERGTTEDEIQDTIKTGFDIPARGNRKGKAKVYAFRQERLGKYYEQNALSSFM